MVSDEIKKAFEFYKVGDEFKFSRTFTQADLSLFVGLTGDFNIFHTNAELSKKYGFDGLILPGMLTGSLITHIGGLMGFLAKKLSFKFIKPVYPNDTVTIVATIIESIKEKKHMVIKGNYFNQNNTKVLECEVVGYPTITRLSKNNKANI